MKKRILSLVMALLTVVSLLPFHTLAEQAEACPYCDYTLAEGGTLIHAENCMAEYAYDGSGDVGKYVRLSDFSVEYNVMVSSDPVTDSGVYFYYDEFVEGTVMRIADWYWDPGTAGLWYQVEFYVGGIVEEALEYWPETAWVLQNYTENWLEEENALTFVSVCDICGGVECQKTHLYCLACEKFGCELTHQFCGYCNDYDCGIDHLAQNKPAEAPVIPEDPVLTEGAEVSITDESGDAVTESFILGAGRKSSLSAWTDLEGEVSYQWQIRVEDQWIDIQGQTEQGILVSPAMFLNVAEDGRVAIRCAVTGGEEVRTSGEIAVILADEPEAAAFAMGSGGASQTEGDTELQKVYVVVQYEYSDGRTAAAPHIAELAPGGAYLATFNLDTIPGYAPELENASSFGGHVTLVDGVLTIDYAAGDLMEEYTVIKVKYVPAYVSYTVIHYWQNVDNDNYTEKERETISTTHRTGEVIDNVENVYPGFYDLLYETPAAAADGSTVVEVYYDRYYYLMKFELGENGYGVDPVYARSGADLEIGTPTRAGYTFLGWKLDGAGEIIAPDNMPKTMPAENRTYVAQWQAETTSYDVVFWYENADDDNYAQAGVLRDINATTGTIVNGSSYANTNFEGRDSTHFTYSHADENVEVEGDGSTVVNVYFTRNVYDLTFVMEGTADNCDVPIHSSHTDYTGDCYTLACDKAHVHDDSCNKTLACGLTVHEHTDSCMICTKPIHPEHILSECYVLDCSEKSHDHTTVGCTLDCKHEHSWGCLFGCNHTHGDDCYTCGKAAGTHNHTIAGGCYKQICTKEIHAAHTDAAGCYKDIAHTHDEECYAYQCGMEEHTHVEACYKLTCDRLHYHSGNTCYLVITRKYDASIADVWKENPVKAIIDDGDAFTWDQTDKQVSFMEKMPGVDSTMTRYDYSGSKVYHWFYYLEVLPGMDTTGLTTRTDTDGKVYYEYDDSTIRTSSNLHLTYDDDYYPITGFDQRYDKGEGGWYKSSGTYYLDFDYEDDSEEYRAYLYYTRNSYTLTFSNNGEIVSGKGGTLLYEQDISGQYFEPAYPSTLEAGAYEFDGWYTSPYFGDTKFSFTTENGDGTVTKATMPAEDITLYAKWVPVTHTVRFYLDKDQYEAGVTIPEQLGSAYERFNDLTVTHGYAIGEIDEPGVAADSDETHPYKGYKFEGWFYIDDNGDEAAFDPENIPVTQDLNLYAKWSSNKLCKYNVYFALDVDNNGVADLGTDGKPIYVADPISGNGLAGHTYTFTAKGGSDLYAGYQTQYFPHTGSHSITVDIQDEDGTGANSFTFLYQQKQNIDYTVRYLEKGTNKELADQKTVSSPNVVVTENFVPVSGYMPDEYQKTLILTSGSVENVITFWYEKDDVNALYVVNYYIQELDDNLEPAGWTRYGAPLQNTGKIGESYDANAIDIDGFTLSKTDTDQYNVEQKKNGATGEELPSTEISALTADGKLTGKLTANGMELNFYYTRNLYPYEFRYMLQGTATQLADPIFGKAGYDQTVTEAAKEIKKDLDGDGVMEDYRLYDPTETTKSIHIRQDGEPLNASEDVTQGQAKVNVATFYYVRCTQTMKVTKTVVDNSAYDAPDPNQEFIIEVLIHSTSGYHQTSYAYSKSDGTSGTLSPEMARPNVLQFTLKAGQTITIDGLPTAEYTVSEQNLPQGYYATYTPQQDNKLTVDAPLEVTVTNTYDPANLTITKTVSVVEENGNVPEVADFQFTIKVPSGVTGNYSYTVGGETRTATVNDDGEMVITLKKGQTATFLNLPLGTYTVEEADYSALGYNSRFVVNSVAPLAEINAVEVDMVRGETQAVQCINAFPVGDLVIEKTVTKEFFGTEWNGDTFTFIVERTTAGRSLVENNKYDVYEGKNKIGTATVADGELQVEIEFTAADATTLQAEGASVTHTLTIKNLPAGDYSVTEKETTAGIDLYNTSVGVGDDATQGTAVSGLTIPAEETKASFTNQLIRPKGNLSLTKDLVKANGYTGELPEHTLFSFTFEATLLHPPDGEYEVVYSPNVFADEKDNETTTPTKVTMVDGKFTLQVQKGQTVTIKNLPIDTYKITEATVPRIANAFYHNGSDVAEPITKDNGNLYTAIPVPAGGTAAVRCVNTYPVDNADLTIVHTNAEEGQIFVYEVENTTTHEIITVMVVGNGSTTIHDLPFGNYTVTQKNDWSWRYGKADETKTVAHSAAESTVTFGQTWIDYWLGGCSNLIKNIFGGS